MPVTAAPGGVLVAAIALAGALTAGSAPRPQEPDARIAAIVEDDRLEVLCTYSNFRRFQVTYNEQIK